MCKKHYTHLLEKQRYMIEEMRKDGKSVRAIARRLGYSSSTISREIRRNRGLRGYRHQQAQQMSEARQRQRSRYCVLTDEVKAQAQALLRQHWSPEQIAGRWKYERTRFISFVTLYRWIRKDQEAGGDLHRYLRNQGRHYAHGYGRKAYRQSIPGRIGIEHRPAIVETKSRLGDWEADTMHGARHQGFLVTLTERVSRLTLIAPIARKEKTCVEQAIIRLLRPIADCVHTITFDNGKEFASHQAIAQTLHCNSFFATPYHSWERGANENANGLIRQYLPKKRSLRSVTEQEIQQVRNRLNHRPRKCLGFKTPAERFQQLSGINYNLATGVAL